jgi:hypothetical protein
MRLCSLVVFTPWGDYLTCYIIQAAWDSLYLYIFPTPSPPRDLLSLLDVTNKHVVHDL